MVSSRSPLSERPKRCFRTLANRCSSCAAASALSRPAGTSTVNVWSWPITLSSSSRTTVMSASEIPAVASMARPSASNSATMTFRDVPVHLIERTRMRSHRFVRNAASEKPERRRHARSGRHDDSPDPEAPGNLGRMRWPRATECDQGEVARIAALLDDMDASGARHVVTHDRIDVARRILAERPPRYWPSLPKASR